MTAHINSDISTRHCREKMVDAMFRRYGFSGVQVQIQAVLTLYSQGGAVFSPASCDALASMPFRPFQANR